MFKKLFCAHHWLKQWADNQDYIRGPGYWCCCAYCGKEKWIAWDRVINYRDRP